MACECCCGEGYDVLEVGDEVPDFTLKTFDPVKADFGEVSLAQVKAAKRWTILFFYPADFTFV